jgi:hypothetical protein
MQLSPALRSELEYYRDIAYDEACDENDIEWTLTLNGYDALLAGKPIPDFVLPMMRTELEYREDRFEGPLEYEYQMLLFELGFRSQRPRRAAKPRQRSVVRDLKNPEYTIPHGKNHYCGPAALAYLLRTCPDTAAYILREVTKRRAIYGTSSTHMIAALARYGLKAIPRAHRRPDVPHPLRRNQRTLAEWLEVAKPGPHDEYLVVVTGHWIVVHGSRWFDNRCHLGKPLALCPYLRKRVPGAYLIKK